MMEIFICFVIFIFVQSIFINGVKSCFDKGMIFEKAGIWLEQAIKNEWVKKPVFKCVKCMASVYGAATFWPLVLYLFGFSIIEIYVFIIDVFSLVVLNFWIYKKL